MLCLRHYGVDAIGRRVTITYFSTQASVGVDAATPEAASSDALVEDELDRPPAGPALILV